ncbi:MAG TPA: hypothetical protein VMF29_04175 [Candidatus Edwardsbacteria bacterium]|nr:hypothetical protein [Candidatus Edwardsbacteria bacterium]
MTAELRADDIRDAAVWTLQHLVQLRSGPRPGAAPAPAPDDAAVEVPFWGALYGKLMVRANAELARTIATRLFRAEQPTPRQCQEALCLAAGAICGTMLAPLRDGRRSCQLESTRIIDNAKGYERLFGEPRLTAHIGCEQGAAVLRVYLNTIDAAAGAPSSGG